MNSSALSALTAIRSFRSPLAKNVFLAEVMTTPVISSRSASSRLTVARIDSPYAAFIVFADWLGSSRVRITTPSSSWLQRIVLLSLLMFVWFSFAWCRCGGRAGRSDALDPGGDAHAATNAQRRQAVATVGALQLV